MGRGRGVAMPKLSKRFNAEVQSKKPLQESLTDAPTDDASSYLGKGNVIFVESLVEPIPLRIVTPGEILEGIDIPLNGYDSEKGTFYSQSDIMNENAQLLARPRPKVSTTIDSSSLDALCIPSASSSAYNGASSNSVKILSLSEHAEHAEDDIPPVLQIDYPASTSGEESADVRKNGVVGIPTQRQISDRERSDAAKPKSAITCPSREASHRYASEKLRKAKISEGIKELKNIVHCSQTYDKEDQDSVLDDTIDYIKYLKLQLKVLSQSRLCGEFAPYPFIYLEGYGHYLLNQMACNEPLEDIIGHIMETTPRAATELLESKGLTVMPTTLAYTLLNPVQGSLPQA